MDTPTPRNRNLEILAGNLKEDDMPRNNLDIGKKKNKARPKAKAKARRIHSKPIGKTIH